MDDIIIDWEIGEVKNPPSRLTDEQMGFRSNLLAVLRYSIFAISYTITPQFFWNCGVFNPHFKILNGKNAFGFSILHSFNKFTLLVDCYPCFYPNYIWFYGFGS